MKKLLIAIVFISSFLISQSLTKGWLNNDFDVPGKLFTVTFELTGGTPGIGKVLTDDGTGAGIAIWSASAGGGANTALSNLASVAINQSLLLGTSDAFALGSATKMWSDLFLASGSVINWDNGDVTLTHSANKLGIEGGFLGIGTATPGYVLEVVGVSRNTSVSQYIELNPVGINPKFVLSDATIIVKTQVLTSSNVGFIGTESNHNVVIGANNQFDQFVIEPAGFVGVGTGDPGTKLHISDSNTPSHITIERVDASIAVDNELGNIYWRGGETTIANIGKIGLMADGGWAGDDSPTYMTFSTTPSSSTTAVERLRIDKDGNINFLGTTIDMITSGTVLTVGVGVDNGTVSAGIFTDRTPFFDGDGLLAIKKIKGKDGKIDHESLPLFVQAKDGTERNIGNMISVNVRALQQLIAINEDLTQRIEILEAQ